jgi:hypothetical protein
MKTKCPNTLCDWIDSIPHFGVLTHEHGVQGVEHFACHIPVEVVRGQVQGVSFSQQATKGLGNRRTLGIGDTNID